MSLISLAIALSLIMGGSNITNLTAIAAAAMAIVTGLRTLENGLKYGSDANRMIWYNDTFELIDAQFEEASLAGKLRLLHETETVCYREMRHFLVEHLNSRFI